MQLWPTNTLVIVTQNVSFRLIANYLRHHQCVHYYKFVYEKGSPPSLVPVSPLYCSGTETLSLIDVISRIYMKQWLLLRSTYIPVVSGNYYHLKWSRSFSLSYSFPITPSQSGWRWLHGKNHKRASPSSVKNNKTPMLEMKLSELNPGLISTLLSKG